MAALLLATAPALAQRLPTASSSFQDHAHEEGEAFVCGIDTERLQAQVAHYGLDRLPYAARHEAAPPDRLGGPEIGDVQEFRTRFGGSLIPFVLVDISDRHYLWVDQARQDSSPVGDDVVAALHTAIAESTPEGSYNPEQGVVDNLQEMFGQPPDYDGDGILDVLLFNIGGGVFASVELPELNGADALFMDPDMFGDDLHLLQAVAAHEYTHLIHINYLDLSNIEELFIVEGIAQYAMVANGYAEEAFVGNGDDYLDHADELNRPLFSWRSRASHPDTFRRDYFRAGLFFTYLASQLGIPAVRDILQNSLSEQGADNIETILAEYDTSVGNIFSDYHVANYLNDAAVDPRYGYGIPVLEDRRIRDTPTAFALHVDGATASETSPTQDGVSTGAVRYYVWNTVQDFMLNLDALGGENGRLRLRAVLEHLNGTVEVRDLTPGPDLMNLSGEAEQLAVIPIQVDLDDASVTVEYAASWSPVTVAVEESGLPQHVHLAQSYPNPFNAETTVSYELGQPTHLTLEIYDVLGRRVRTLVDAVQDAGSHEVVWDGRSAGGHRVGAGAYIVRLRAGNEVQSRKVLLLR